LRAIYNAEPKKSIKSNIYVTFRYVLSFAIYARQMHTYEKKSFVHIIVSVT